MPRGDDALYKHNLMVQKSTRHIPRNVFTITGAIVVALLCVVPLWNAGALLADSNYVFWIGITLPCQVFVVVVCVLTGYVVTVYVFFSFSPAPAQNEQTIMMVSNMFVTLLGVILMLLSQPLCRQANYAYDELMHHCEYSQLTHRTFEYSQVLHNIRRQPDCLEKRSVEECTGYAEAAPYTWFLKALEADFRCSGFCFRPQLGRQTNGSLDMVSHTWRPRSPVPMPHGTKVPDVMDEPTGVHRHRRQEVEVSRYPPTLFSNANYKSSCEGMAARDMKNFVGDIGHQSFAQGLYLLLIAIATGFLKLVTHCRYGPPPAGDQVMYRPTRP